jgi:hypothetical protein
MDSRPIRDTELWRRVVRNGWLDTLGLQELQMEVSTADVRAVVAMVLPAGDTSERAVGLLLLDRLVAADDPRFEPAERERMRLALRAQLLDPKVFGPASALRLWVRLDFETAAGEFRRRFEPKGSADWGIWRAFLGLRDDPQARIGAASVFAYVTRAHIAAGRDLAAADSLQYWVEAAPSDAATALLEGDLRVTALPKTCRRACIRGLVHIGGARVVPLLRTLAEAPGPDGKAAMRALEILGAEPPVALDALAARWRKTRSAKGLARLYDDYLEALPMGTPFDAWLDRLGYGGVREGMICIAPRTKEGTTLFVETDSERRLRGISLK